MRLRKATAARAQITDVHMLSRALLNISKIEPDIEFSVDVEYAPKPKKSAKKRPSLPDPVQADWVESWTMELSFDPTTSSTDEEEDEEDCIDSITIKVRERVDGTFNCSIQVEDSNDHEPEHFDNLEAVYSEVYGLVYPAPKEVSAAQVVEPLVPTLKLVQQSIAHGPQSIWVSHLDITKVNSNGNALIDFRVPCAMVGYSVHIADMRHFLKAIKFDLSVLESKPHNLFSNVQKELITRIGGAVKLATPGATGKVTDSQGTKYLVFTLQTLGENSSVIHGMIDLRPEDFPNGEEDEEDDEADDFQ